jgi:hypothetical protein
MVRGLESYKRISKRRIIWFDITDEKSRTVYPIRKKTPSVRKEVEKRHEIVLEGF